MPAVTSCPDQHVLKQFILGRLAPEEVDRLAGHIEQCPACIAALNTVRADDTFADAMMNSSVVDEPGPTVGGLIARLAKLKPPAAEETAALPASGSLTPSAGIDSGDRTEFGADACDFLAPAQGPGEIGRLGSYRILKVLGAGGMGVVFLAEDVQLKRTIALKTMKPAIAANTTSRQRFLREAQAAALLESDYIVPIYQVGEDRSVPYLAMPFLKGSSLDDRLKKGELLKVPQVIRLGIQIVRGLATAHEAGLIHRDIKPANIWIEPEGGGRAKILDFGLARSTSEDSHLTQSGSIVGTLAYMAPEQARGEKIDGRCDLFSFGCVLYRMLTGVQPFQGAETMATLLALAMHNPPPPIELNPSLPAALSGLVMRLLSKDPAGRPATAKGVVEELQGIERELTRPESGSSSAPVRPRSRSRLLIAGAALLAVGLLAGIIFRITRKDGKVEDIELKPGDKLEVVEKKDDKKPADGTLDALDPAKIPAEERFAWQPKELVAVVGEHRGRVWSDVASLSVSPDGKTIAVSGNGSKTMLLDAMTLREKTILWDVEAVTSAFSPDGRTLVTGAGGAVGNLWLWDFSGPEPKKRKLMEGDQSYFSFSKDGKILATSNFGFRDVHLWDLSGNLPKEMPGIKNLKEELRGLAISADGKTVVTGHENAFIAWDRTGPNPKQRGTIDTKGGALAWDGTTLVLRGADGRTLVFWDITAETLKQRASIKVTKNIEGAALAMNGKTLALHLADNDWKKEISIVDLSGPEPRDKCTIPDVNASRLAFSANGDTLAAATVPPYGQPGTTIRVWALNGMEPQERVPAVGHPHTLSAALPSPDGKTLATFENAVLRFWDMTGPTPRLRSEHKGVWSGAFSPDSKSFASTVGDTVQLWDLRGAEPEVRLKFQPEKALQLRQVSFAPDGKTLALADHTPSEDRIRFYDVSGEEPKEGGRLTGFRGPMAYSPDGKTFVCASAVVNGDVYQVWDLSGKEPKNVSVFGSVGGGSFRVGFSPDGQNLAADFCYKGVHLWRLDKDKARELATITDPEMVAAYPWWSPRLAFAPDGKSIAYSLGSAVVVWSVEGKKEPKRLHHWRFPGGVNDVSFASDGRHLITANYNGTAYVLRLAPAP